MISQQIYEEQRQKVLKFFEEAKIALTEEEKKNIEVADFGLDDIDQTALQLSVFINTDRVCAKEMVLFAGQPAPNIVILLLMDRMVRKKHSVAVPVKFTCM